MGGLRIETEEERIRLVDPVRRESLTVTAATPVSATPATPPPELPVEAAVTVTTDGFSVPRGCWTVVRDADDRLLAQFDYDVAERFPDGTYTIQFEGPLKGYVRVAAPLRIADDGESLSFSFDGPAELLVGGRVRRLRPRETVTTTTDGADLLRAVSALPSTLQSTTPERSFPSLRGHPPAIEVGDSLRIPDGLQPPETGLELLVPPSPAFAFPVAPVAYYLGAAVRPGRPPRLQRTDGTVLHEFDASDFDADVHAVLRHLFTLDCAVRTEGLYPVPSQLRRDLGARLPDVEADFADLYERPLAERTERYLAIPRAPVRECAPRWPLGAVVEPSPEHATALPYLVNELAHVTVRTPEVVSGAEARREALDAFLHPEPSFPRAAGEVFVGAASFAKLPELPTTHSTYVGDHVPLGGGKFRAAGARNRDRREPGDEPLSVTVVCNDRAMDGEATSIEACYGAETSADIAVDTAYNVSTGDLRALVQDDVDVLHFVGHATPAGLECSDGLLDVAEVPAVRVSSFVLNACQSYRQGLRLIERGAVAGAVALSDVENEDAIDVGVSLSRFLTVGFPFRTAVALARRASVVGGQYLVAGDGGLTLARPESLIPHLVSVEAAGGDRWRVSIDMFTTAGSGLGSLFTADVDACDAHHVNSGTTPAFELGTAALREFLDAERVPVEFESALRWSDEFTLPE